MSFTLSTTANTTVSATVNSTVSFTLSTPSFTLTSIVSFTPFRQAYDALGRALQATGDVKGAAKEGFGVGVATEL